MTETIKQLSTAIDFVTTQAPILIFRGMNSRRHAGYMSLSEGESIFVGRFVVQHADNNEGDFIIILLPSGENAFYLNAVNDIPGEAIYSAPRQVELLVKVTSAYELATLDGETDDANGEEEVLLGPGTFTRSKLAFNGLPGFEYKSLAT